MKLGQTITEIRKERGMTQEEFAAIFHVTRQTVSNWEKEKSYPDLQTLVDMSDEFRISLDVMLKEDKRMVKKVTKEIKFGKHIKRIMIWSISILIIAGSIWGVIWNQAKDDTEEKFQKGIKANQFIYQEELGHYTRYIDDNTYFELPNQKMPDYFEFTKDFYAKSLDCYTKAENQSLWIRWTERGDATIYLIDKKGNIKSTLTQKEKDRLIQTNPHISKLFTKAQNIYQDVYK